MKLFILTTLFAAFSLHVSAQCDHTVILQSTNGRFVNGKDRQSDMPLEATVQVFKDKIVLTLSINGRNSMITSKIDQVNCDWQDFLVNGNTEYKVTTDKGDGHPEASLIRLISRNGKSTIYFGSDPDKKGGLELDVLEVKSSQ